MILFLLLAFDTPLPSPHGSSAHCASCHEPTVAGSVPDAMSFATGSADGACRQCHREDPHAVGMAPNAGQVPASFPLVAGKMACITCHDEPSCDALDTAAPYLRGGPYSSMGGLCAQCHPSTARERLDPHAAMAAEPGDAHVCELCHQTAPDRQATEADLKVAGPDICVGCHTDTRHAGMLAHRGAVPVAMAARARAAGLPLGEGDALVCLTCHDPHPPGATAQSEPRKAIVGTPVLPTAWLQDVWAPALVARAEDAGTELHLENDEPAYLRLPLRDGTLCAGCHDVASKKDVR